MNELEKKFLKSEYLGGDRFICVSGWSMHTHSNPTGPCQTLSTTRQEVKKI